MTTDDLFYYTGGLVWCLLLAPVLLVLAFLVVLYVLSLVQISYRFARCPHKMFKDGITWHRRLAWLFMVLPQHALRSHDSAHFGPRHDLYFIYGEKAHREHERLEYERYEQENEDYE